MFIYVIEASVDGVSVKSNWKNVERFAFDHSITESDIKLTFERDGLRLQKSQVNINRLY